MPPLHHLIKPSQARDLLQEFAALIPGSGLALLRSDRRIFAQAGEQNRIPPAEEMDSGVAGIQALFAGNELVAYLAASPDAVPVLPPLSQSLSLLLQQALEKREIARETLDRYRN
jgi:hypothetical protein